MAGPLPPAGDFGRVRAMRAVLPGGFLVVVEGVDGTGKTTVSSQLAQFCGERGLLCAYSKEPTGVGAGRQLRESARAGRLDVDEEQRLFLQDRMAHAARTIRPTLAAGGVVILDRYYWSTAAYQGARGVDPFQIVADNEAQVPRPDLVLLLDAAPQAGLDRVLSRGDVPDEFEKAAALERAREIFADLHAAHPDFSVRIDAGAELRAVQGIALATFLERVVAALTARGGDPAVAALLAG